MIVFGNAMSSQSPHLAFSSSAMDWLKTMLAPVGALVLGPAITNLAPAIKDKTKNQYISGGSFCVLCVLSSVYLLVLNATVLVGAMRLSDAPLLSAKGAVVSVQSLVCAALAVLFGATWTDAHRCYALIYVYSTTSSDPAERIRAIARDSRSAELQLRKAGIWPKL